MKINTRVLYFLSYLIMAVSLLTCQKELDYVNDGIINPVKQKPKVGTIWTYRYYTYSVGGGLATSKTLVYKAKSEETHGGEQWLNVVDIATDTTAYLLNEKAGGLYQYINNGSYLFCKDSATVNETYNTFFQGDFEDFVVKGFRDSLPTGIGIIPLNYYEGYRVTNLVDQVWYNGYAWLVWKVQYRKFLLGTVYYKYSSLYLDEIIY